MTKHKIHAISLQTRITDLNYGNHVGLPNVTGFFHQARALYFDGRGLSELNIGEGVGILLKSGMYEFKHEIMFNDVLSISVYLADISKCGFSFYYEAVKESSQELMVTGKEEYICFNYATKKVSRLPHSLRETVEWIN